MAHTKTKTEQTVVDPVCGQQVNPEKAEHSSNYNAKLYYFCSDACKNKFVEDPEAYTGDNG